MKLKIFCVFASVATTIFAQTPNYPNITIDGEKISNNKIHYGSLRLLEPHERCSPQSDTLLRERVVSNILLHRWYVAQLEKNNAKAELDALAQFEINIKDTLSYIETETPDGKLLDQLYFRNAIYSYSTDYNNFVGVNTVSSEELEAEKQRLKSIDHPLLNNTVAVKVRGIDIHSAEKSKKIAAALNSGTDIEEVRKAFGVEANPITDGARWIPVMPKSVAPIPDYNGQYWRDRYPKWNSDLQIGQVVGPHIRWLDPSMDSVGKLTYTYYVVTDRTETQRLAAKPSKDRPTKSELEPFKITELQKAKLGKGFKTPAEKASFINLWVERLIETNRYEDLKTLLRIEADVRQDGIEVSADIDFQGCGELTPESTQYNDAIQNQ